jgi:hypothetical protein
MHSLSDLLSNPLVAVSLINAAAGILLAVINRSKSKYPRQVTPLEQ